MNTIIFNSIRNADTGFITSVSFCFTLTSEGKTVYSEPYFVSFEDEPEDMVAFDNVTEAMISEWVNDQFEDAALAVISSSLQDNIDSLPSAIHGLPY